MRSWTFRRIAKRRSALPLASSSVAAGFPSPADDYLESPVDLVAELAPNPDATFMVTAAGKSMIGAGIHPGDTLIVDRSVEARDRSVVIAVVNGELTVKRLRTRGKRVTLESENPEFTPITFEDGDELSIWGVVTHCIKAL